MSKPSKEVTYIKSEPHCLMQFFTYDHLPKEKQFMSKCFCDVARYIDGALPNNPEKTAALRKLLESKDCAVRATFFTTTVH